jgi:hypothetical protein
MFARTCMMYVSHYLPTIPSLLYLVQVLTNERKVSFNLQRLQDRMGRRRVRCSATVSSQGEPPGEEEEGWSADQPFRASGRG